MASGIIEHEGIVSRVEGDRVYVKITSQSACGTCKAREACGLAEAQEKIVEVTTPGAQQHYTAGESVTVGVRRSAGAVAVILAYVGALAVCWRCWPRRSPRWDGAKAAAPWRHWPP